jgi:hypothetical protein
MLKKTVIQGSTDRVVIMDSITKVAPEDKGATVLSASHGGASSGEFALEVPLKLVLFNDAGIGKNDAGIAALAMLARRGVAGAAISHTSGMIGDAQDMWDHGVISRVNAQAEALGLVVGKDVKSQLSVVAS